MAQRRNPREKQINAAIAKFFVKNAKYANSTWRGYSADIVEVLEEFSQLFNLAPPRSKGKRGYWVKVAKDALVELGSAERVVERMRWLIDERKAGRKLFDVYSPHSIFTVITAVPLEEAQPDQGLRSAIQRRLEGGMTEAQVIQRYIKMKSRSGQAEVTSRSEILELLADIQHPEEFDYENW